MKHIVALESDTRIPIVANEKERSLTHQQAEELERLIEAKKLSRKYIRWGRDYLLFVNYVGFIQLHDVSIEILPKCTLSTSEEDEVRDSRENLIRMLCRIGYLNIKISEMSMLKLSGRSLFEFFGGVFASYLEQELQKGVIRDYLICEDELKIQRGRVLLSKQVSNIARRTGRVHCLYEEFDLQNFLNVILKSAVRMLLYRIQNTDTRKRLRKCDLILGDVEVTPVSERDLKQFQLNRLNKRYENCVLLAKLFLQNQSPFPEKGEKKSFAILFPMEDVYEKYIAHLLKENMNLTVHTKHKEYKLLINEDTGRKSYVLEPDIIIEENGQAKLLMDTKWKKIDEKRTRHGLKRDDLFQMYTYVTRYPEAQAAILLYPHHEELSDKPGVVERWQVDGQDNKRIQMYALDLSNERNTVESLLTIVSEFVTEPQ